jgi:hypothetical protein
MFIHARGVDPIDPWIMPVESMQRGSNEESAFGCRMIEILLETG